MPGSVSKYANKTATAMYKVRVLIKMKQTKDTRKACGRGQPWRPYLNGQLEPHFPVPAIRYETVFPWENTA
jgi:hypothetical protein